LMPIMIFMTRYYHSYRLPRRIISVSHKIFNLFHLMLFAMVTFYVSSCEEGTTIIGEDLLPGSDFVNIKSIDTLSAWSYTMYDEVIRTDNPSIGYLGKISDPYFGSTDAEFVTQVRLFTEWTNNTYTIDSIKLFLHLLTAKGGSDNASTLSFSEIGKQIYTDSVYYSNSPVPGAIDGYKIDNIKIPPLRTDTINDIQIPLPVEFGNYLIRDQSMLFHSNTKPDFRSHFKGLYFRISSGSDPLMVSLYLDPPNSSKSDHSGSQNYFVLYMHDEAAVQSQYYFILDAVNRNAAFTLISHNFNAASPGKRIKHINDGFRDTLSYLQHLNGVYTKISLPGLEALKNNPSFIKNIAVNKARLVVPVFFDGGLYKASTAPPQLVLRYKTKTGNKYIVPDYSIDQYNRFFDGTIDTTASLYRFNIPSFVQGYFEDVTNGIKPELEIYQGAGTSNVILKANGNKTPVKFEFTYTRF
jgi:hypothetical protein